MALALPLPRLGHGTTAHYCSFLPILQVAPPWRAHPHPPPHTVLHSGRDPPASAPASDLPPSSGGHWSLYPRGHSLTECPSGSLSTWDEVHSPHPDPQGLTGPTLCPFLLLLPGTPAAPGPLLGHSLLCPTVQTSPLASSALCRGTLSPQSSPLPHWTTWLLIFTMSLSLL